MKILLYIQYLQIDIKMRAVYSVFTFISYLIHDHGTLSEERKKNVSICFSSRDFRTAGKFQTEGVNLYDRIQVAAMFPFYVNFSTNPSTRYICHRWQFTSDDLLHISRFTNECYSHFLGVYMIYVTSCIKRAYFVLVYLKQLKLNSLT